MKRIVVLCLLALLFLVPGAARAYDIQVVLETGIHAVGVDTIALVAGSTQEFPVRMGGEPGRADTVQLRPDTTPTAASVSWSLEGRRMPTLEIPDLEPNEWYTILGQWHPDAARIKFLYRAGIEELPGNSKLAALAASPNPFRLSTGISCQVSEAGRVQVSVFDRSGRTVRTLADARFEPGTHRFSWNGRDATGDRVSPGVYLLRATTDRGSALHKLVLTD